jgi:hypothetical protein
LVAEGLVAFPHMPMAKAMTRARSEATGAVCRLADDWVHAVAITTAVGVGLRYLCTGPCRARFLESAGSS